MYRDKSILKREKKTRGKKKEKRNNIRGCNRVKWTESVDGVECVCACATIRGRKLNPINTLIIRLIETGWRSGS